MKHDITYPYEVVVDDLVGELVNLLVLVLLQTLDLVETAALLDRATHRLRVLARQLQDVVDAVENDLHNL